MNWYIAKNVFQIIIGNGCHQPQFEEQMTLICATSLDNAFEKAIAFGKEKEESFIDINGELVTWNYINPSNIHQVNSLADGTVLCTRTEEPDFADNYIAWVNEANKVLF